MSADLILEVQHSGAQNKPRFTRPFFPWPLTALLVGIAAAGLLWLLILSAAFTAWLANADLLVNGIVSFANQFFLLAHGVAFSSGLSLVPLGVTGLGFVLTFVAARIAAWQIALVRPNIWWATVCGAALVMLGYVGVAMCIGLSVGSADDWMQLLGSAAAVSALGGLFGSIHKDILAIAPRWLLRLRAGWLGAIAVLAISAVAVLSVAVCFSWERVNELDALLFAPGVDQTSWILLCLAWLPNLLIWALSWALGTPIDLGVGAITSLSGTQLGLLPTIPFFGLLPPTGVGNQELVLWMGLGVLAGIAAGTFVGVVRPGLRLLEAFLVSGGSGLLAAGTLVGLAAISSGDLGTLRMVGFGAQLPMLAILTFGVIPFSAAMWGAAFAFWHGTETAPVKTKTAPGKTETVSAKGETTFAKYEADNIVDEVTVATADGITVTNVGEPQDIKAGTNL